MVWMKTQAKGTSTNQGPEAGTFLAVRRNMRDSCVAGRTIRNGVANGACSSRASQVLVRTRFPSELGEQLRQGWMEKLCERAAILTGSLASKLSLGHRGVGETKAEVPVIK